MKRYKSKYRIHTFVFRRRAYYFFLLLLTVTLILYTIVRVPKAGTGTIYESLGKLCIDAVMMHRGETKNVSADIFKIGHEAIMSQASVFFTDYDKSESIARRESIQAMPLSAKEVKEKNISSENMEIKNETSYTINKDELLNTPKSYRAKGEQPKVLIVHTHACETYSDKNGAGLGDGGSYRTLDTEKNMVKIGKVIADVFKAAGVNVIHDNTLCDYPAYNSSYVKSLGVIEWYLERYPEIEFVFDIHRDAIEDENGIPSKLTANINNKKCAQVMIVCGTDASGLYNPHWQENLTLALKIQKNLETMYPGLMRPVNVRKERFNMHKTKGSLLFEVGTHGNTLEEAIYAAESLANGIMLTIG